MKTRLILIILVLVVAGYFMASYLLESGSKKSKATGESITMSFNPSSATAAVSQDFVEMIKIKPSVDLRLRGYLVEFNFPKESFQLKKIMYKMGVVSEGMGNTDANLVQINSSGAVKLQGQIQTSTGEVMTSVSSYDLVELTFSALNTTAAKIDITPDKTKFFIINSDYSLSEIPSAGAVQFTVNGSGNTSPTIAPTLPPGSINMNINIKTKFQGVIGKPEDKYNKMSTSVTIVSGNFKQEKKIDFIADASGVWQGQAAFTAPPKADYQIFLKGPKHMKKKICDSSPQETYPGTYRCGIGKIELASANQFDLTGVLNMVGDVPPQDGMTTSSDISAIYNNIGKTGDDILAVCDFNLDGKCDTQDYSLLIGSMGINVDDQ